MFMMDSNLKNILKKTDIVCSNMDDLVVQGIENIFKNGVRVSAKAKHCLQVYNVSYTLTNPLDRVLTLRQPHSIRYLCRELLAFFKGSLKVHDGLSNASKFWEKIADKNNEINSNYGHYVFHMQLPEANQTQYDWVISCFREDLDTRQALVNISQIHHKTRDVLDFPCTLGLQFYVVDQYFCCEVFSRSTDVIWGLPYDMGFFSFLTELLYKDVKRILPIKEKTNLKLGYVRMNTCFTQIYDITHTKAKDVLNQLHSSRQHGSIQMPTIDCVDETIADIYNGTQKTKILKWINSNAQH